jgi:ribosome-binding ATPase YchF (GTP1/OBG family)
MDIEIIKGTHKVRKEGLDKFYTLPECSKKCIDKTCELYDIARWDLIVEPSAGNGSFFNQIQSDK